MIFSGASDTEAREASKLLNKYIAKGKRFEMKIVREKRSLSQNSYLHVLFGLFGAHFGFSIEEAKAHIKRNLGCYHETNGEKFLDQTSKMDSKQLSNFIEKMRRFSSEGGLYLPSADEHLRDWAIYDNILKENESWL